MNSDDGWALRSAAAIVLAVALTTAGAAQAQRILKREPPPGGLRGGEVVLVDDRTCPPGQIKQVSAGKGRRGDPGSVERTRQCVARR